MYLEIPKAPFKVGLGQRKPAHAAHEAGDDVDLAVWSSIKRRGPEGTVMILGSLSAPCMDYGCHVECFQTWPLRTDSLAREVWIHVALQENIWVVVKIMVPFWIPIIIRHLISRGSKKGP